MKKITADIKKQIISDVLDRGIAIHIVQDKYGLPAAIINKLVDDFEDRQAEQAANPSKPEPEPVAAKPAPRPNAPTATSSQPAGKTKVKEESAESSAAVADLPTAETSDSAEEAPNSSASRSRLVAVVLIIALAGGVWFSWESFTSDSETPGGGGTAANTESGQAGSDTQVQIDPTFQTPVTQKAGSRLAIKTRFVDTEDRVFDFGEDEFYLELRLSKFPDDLSVLIPVSVGEQKFGTNDRYVTLPFEYADGDKLSVKLREATGLDSEDRDAVLAALERPGFCLIKGPQLHKPTEEFLKYLDAVSASPDSEVEVPVTIGQRIIKRLRPTALQTRSETTVELKADEIPSDQEESLVFDMEVPEGEQLQLLIYAPLEDTED